MEKGKRTTYLQLKSVCFYEKQTPLQYLHVLSAIFFLFIFLSCIKKGQFVVKGFHYNIDKNKRKEKTYLTHFPSLWETTNDPEVGNELWTATVEWNRDDTRGIKRQTACSQSQHFLALCKHKTTVWEASAIDPLMHPAGAQQTVA